MQALSSSVRLTALGAARRVSSLPLRSPLPAHSLPSMGSKGEAIVSASVLHSVRLPAVAQLRAKSMISKVLLAASAATLATPTASAYKTAESLGFKDVAGQKVPDAEKYPLVLFQYEACPYCSKIKAFLDYFQVPYHIVETKPRSKPEIAFTSYKKVPVLRYKGETLVDSQNIINALAAKGAFTLRPVSEDESKWLKWVDERLTILLPLNIYRTVSESYQSMGYIAEQQQWKWHERIYFRLGGAVAMKMHSAKRAKQLNLNPGDERKAMYDAVNDWLNAVGSKPFYGGEQPSTADLAVFGVLRSLQGYILWQDLLKNTKVGEYYTRMEKVMPPSSRVRPNLNAQEFSATATA